MTTHPQLPNFAVICSPIVNRTVLNAFIIQASVPGVVRDYVLAQKGQVAKNILNTIQNTLQSSHAKHPLRRHMFYIIRSLAFETHQFPDSLILNRFDVTVDLTRPKFAGGAGNVYKGEMRGRPIAVKEIKALEHEQYYIYREASVWAQLSHRHLAKLLGIVFDFTRPSLPLLVSPWMDRGTLHTYISSNNYVQLKRRWPLASQIAQAIAYLHGQKVFHGDIKDTNILIDDGHNALLTDFGLSIVGEVTIGHYTATGTTGSLAWMAPERFDHKVKRRTPEMDIYAYGCICYLLCRGKIMFGSEDLEHGVDGPEVSRRIRAGERPIKLTTCGDGTRWEGRFWELTTLCWDQIPARRISMNNVLAFFDISLAAVVAQTALFITTSAVAYEPKVDETRLKLDVGDLLHVINCTDDMWTVRNETGYVGHVDPKHLNRATQLWAKVTLPSNDIIPLQGIIKRLPVSVGQTVDVVAIREGYWLVRSLEDINIGVLEPRCLKPIYPSFDEMKVRQSVALFEYAPGTRPHALPLQKGEFYDTWSCSPSDFWRIARAKAQDGEFTYGIVPSHYLEWQLKRPRLLMDPIVVTFDSKKKKKISSNDIVQLDKNSKKWWQGW